ncbi:ImmA/IrrE family metallo-endopeptidase [Magnetovirga frankeli]|uniref:XRE family transcriptional regulator n=1 Tax=Magnetovirga frankeli TaxID=947516 RepID=UPI001292F974|nr:ImmA/IrrE family metallo-endopeptidase [gamma proteobacterium SS-5]
MQKLLNKAAVAEALTLNGLTQKELAERLDVSPQAITNWMKGKDFPRPAALLKLAAALRLTFDQLTVSQNEGRPIVAFRKKGNAKTTAAHIAKAEAIGLLLRPLVPYLSEIQALRPLITSPGTDYQRLQTIVAQTRKHLGLGESAVLRYEHLIGEFNRAGAILVPVLWGDKQRHENALHIRLPQEDVTFIFLNLDTRIEDFKFWMAHELAHVYTPDWTGQDKGEDFADAFAGALLFPEACAAPLYDEAKGQPQRDALHRLQAQAHHHSISLNTVFQQVQHYAQAKGYAPLPLRDKDIHVVRTSRSGPLITEALFEPAPPAPDRYLAACEHSFQSDFFNGLRRMIHEQGTGAGYLQQVLDIAPLDAKALYEELAR